MVQVSRRCREILVQQGLGSVMVVPVSFKERGSGVLGDQMLDEDTQPRNRSLFLAARSNGDVVFQQSDLRCL